MFLTISLLSILLVTYLVKRLCYQRFEQFAPWPQLKPSLLWGHLGNIQDVVTNGPLDMHIDYICREISEKLGNPPAFVLDLRPVTFPLCVICSHKLAEQVSMRSKKYPYSLPKSALDSSYAALLGHRPLLTMQGEEWRTMRQRLNPAFSKSHLTTLIPYFLGHISPFLECLDRYSRDGADFPLQEPLAALTLNIMGTILIGASNNSPGMDRQHEIMLIFSELHSTYSFDPNVPSWFTNPLVRWRRNRSEKKLNALLKQLIHKFYEQINTESDKGSVVYTNSRSVLALALKDVEHLTTEVIELVCDQFKILLFAGSDTIIHLLAWLFYELSITPRAMKALWDELDYIFGPDAEPNILKDKLLSNTADVVGRMPYASALIKETLRMHPPGGTCRTVPLRSGDFLRMPDGSDLCMDGLSFYNCHSIIHRDEEVWGDTKNTFLPERWLSPLDASSSLNPETVEKPGISSAPGAQIPPGAFRPFERGPRNCIGQELALIVPYLVLIFAVRRYDFSKIGLGQVARNAKNEPILNSSGQYEVRSQLYNARRMVPKPVDGMRMRVKLHPNN